MELQGSARYLTIGSMVLAVIASLAAYRLHLTAENEKAARSRAEEIASQAAKAKEVAERQAAEAERRARDAEVRADRAEIAASSRRQSAATARASVAYDTQESAQMAAAAQRDAAARRDAAELARLDTLRVHCEAFMKTRPGGAGAVMGHKACSAYYEALKRRQYYEAARTGLPPCNPNVRICP